MVTNARKLEIIAIVSKYLGKYEKPNCQLSVNTNLNTIDFVDGVWSLIVKTEYRGDSTETDASTILWDVEQDLEELESLEVCLWPEYPDTEQNYDTAFWQVVDIYGVKNAN